MMSYHMKFPRLIVPNGQRLKIVRVSLDLIHEHFFWIRSDATNAP